MTEGRAFDAVDLSIMWDRLVSITDEGAAALIRTSFSTLVREGFDLSVLVFDARGRMIAQSQKCIPVFIGTASVTLSHMLAKFPGRTLHPGDVISTGTPPGVGLSMKPPRFLRSGDVVTLGIAGLGDQRQGCIDA